MKKIISKLTKGLLALLLGGSCIISTFSLTSVDVFAKEESVEVEAEESYTQYVDPFVCTDVDYGQLFPGSVVPNGLVKLSPDTYPHDTLDHAGYDYSKTQIQGFSHTRVEGVGGQGAGGDVLVTPTYVTYSQRPSSSSKAMTYSKESESAKPGYYSVELTPNTGEDNNVKSDSSLGTINAELTTAEHTGYHKYTFPVSGSVNIITDLNYTYHGTDVRNAILDVIEESDTTTAIGGRFSGKNVSGYGKYTLYFYMETSKPATSVQTWNDTTLSNAKSQSGNDIGAIFSFDVEKGETIELKVSISTISVEQAKIDMHNEINGWDFDHVYEQADQAWNDILSKVRIESSESSDPDGTLKKLFYTHLYHMFMTPVNATSTSSTYRGTDGKIYEANDYTHYDSWTLWDDYRKYAMIGLIEPDTYKDMIQSITDALNTGIVTWSHDKQTVPNVRTEHAIALLADGIAKGYTDIDGLASAYEAAKTIANNAITSSVEAQGYFTNRVDKTAEYAYDDWCLSIVANALGLEEESEYYLERSMNYKNTFRSDAIDSPFSDNTLGLLWNKKANGEWSTSSPTKIGADGLYQGSMWQYTWYDSNDINGLMELMGGEEAMLEALMYMFGMQDTSDGSLYLHNAANEVELNLPYYFNYVGRADLTQYWIRKIYTGKSYNTGYASGTVEEQMYKLSPDGYLETMDDDAGTMAMMFVSSAMGIFPMTPGDTAFQIGTPFFDKMTLDVGNGKTFTIIADGVSSENYYIQSAKFNGEEFNRTWIDYSEITTGGVLYFEMGNEPSDWGSYSVTTPSSSDYAPTSYSDEDVIQYSTGTFTESDANDGSVENSIEITITESTFKGNVNDDLIKNGMIVVENLPEGLCAQAIKQSDTSVLLSLSGKAKGHSANDSVSNVSVKITEEAVANAEVLTKSVRATKNNIRITFKDDTLSYSVTKLMESEKDDGSISGSAIITLQGDTIFTGSINEDFVKTNKVNITNLPQGLEGKVVKTDTQTLLLTFEGKANEHDYDVAISIDFKDSAFDGNTASMIKNSSLSGMNAFVLDFVKDYTLSLQNKIEEACALEKEMYTSSTYENLMNVVEEAKLLLTKDEASESEMKEMITEITYYIEQLQKISLRDALDTMEAESSDCESTEVNPYNNIAFKHESINLGNTYDGGWIGYYNVDFSMHDITDIAITYAGKSSNCASDSRIEVRLDGIDGTLLAILSTPPTGSNWSNYVTVSAEIEDPSILTGVHDVYFVMRGTTNSTYTYIANIDCMQFKEKEEEVIDVATSYKVEFEKEQTSGGSNWSGGALKTETSTDASGNSLVNIGGTYADAWLKYNDINFDLFASDAIEIRYVNNSNRCKEDATLHFYLDSMDNDPFASVAIPTSGSNWNAYTTVKAMIDAELSGTHTLYVKMSGSGSNPYIANLDWFEFSKVEKSTEYKVEFEKEQTSGGSNWSGGALKMETSTDASGNSLVNIGGTYADAWLKYNDINFDLFASDAIEIRYVNNSNRCKKDATLHFYLDSMDNDPFASVAIPTSGSNWNAYTTVKATIDAELSGTHTLYVKMSGSESNPYIANLDWFKFYEEKEVILVDTSALTKAYNEANSLLEKSDLYELVDVLRLEKYTNKALEVLENENSTQQEVDETCENLNRAMSLLTYRIIEDLNDLICEAEGLNGNYTAASKTALDSAITEAKNVVEEEFNYDAYVNAYKHLQEAMQNLLVRGDKSELEMFVNEILALDEDLYTVTSWDVLADAYEKANIILQNEDALQDEIDNVYQELKDAYNALVDIASLKTLVEELEKVDTSSYAKESVKVFEKALDEARDTLITGTSEEVEAAKEVLLAAFDGLTKVEGTNTGDVTNVAGLLAMLLASAYVLSKKRKA